MWSPLGAGFDGTVRSLTVTPTGIVAAGAFNASGLVTTPKIAKFDGDMWTSPNNQAPNEIVTEIVTVGTDVYVAGGFTRVAGIPANYVARWDSNDETWSSVGHGLEYAPDNFVRAMAYDTDRGELYCADNGQFGGVTNLVRWNGAQWQAVNGVFPAHKIHKLAYVDGTLYAGGDEPSLNNIAKLTNPGVLGGQWQSLGTGLSPPTCCWQIGVSDILGADGYVYVAGRFACSVPTGTVYGLARWNGSTWSEVGDCCESEFTSIWGLAYDGSAIYEITSTALGRYFNSTWIFFGGEGGYQATIEVVGGNLYKGDEDGFKRWSGGRWDPVGACGIDMPVVTIGGVGGDVLVGGTFWEAGCKVSRWFARWQDTVVAVDETPSLLSQVDVIAFPNPFNPMTTIRFNAENAGVATVRVFDVTGRFIKTLLNRSVAAGSHTISWDGTRANGEHVVSGLYFCEVRTGGRRAVAKLALLK